MSHPDIAGTAEATLAAFELLYQPKGWVLADDQAAANQLAQQLAAAETPAAPIPAPVTSQES
jgi:hypothetical protein